MVHAHLDQQAQLPWWITELKYGQYDDLNSTALFENPVGTYKNLIYKTWTVGGIITLPVSKVGGIADRSPPHSAVTAVDVQVKNGTPLFTVAKPYKTFSVFDFYFGCILRTDEGTVNEAAQ